MIRRILEPPPWFDELHEVWGYSEKRKKAEATFYINQDRTPPSKAEMARRLSRDRALARWHTDRSIEMDFETWWEMLERGRAA